MTPITVLIKNATIATMQDNCEAFGLIEDGAIAISDETIVFVGKMSDLTASLQITGDEIDAQGQLVTPGLIDCHTHIVFGGNRALEFEMRLNGASYEEIAMAGGGIVSTVKHTREASPDELYNSAKKRLQNLINDGVTTLEIKSGYGLNMDDEIKMLEVARSLGNDLPIDVKTTFLGAHAVPPEYKGNADIYIRQICDYILPEVAKRGLADAVDAFCEKIGFSPEQTREVFDKAQELGLPIKLHADQLSDLGGGSLVASYKGLSADHVEYSSTKSLFDMAREDTVAVLLPGAFYALNETKKPDVKNMRKLGVKMALATDCNPGSSPVQSLLLMLSMGCTLFGLTPEESLAGVTKNAAQALGLTDVGIIAANMKANLALWDVEHPAELSYWIGSSPLKTRIYQGKAS